MIPDKDTTLEQFKINALEREIGTIHKWMELTNQQIVILQDQVIILKKLIDLPQ